MERTIGAAKKTEAAAKAALNNRAPRPPAIIAEERGGGTGGQPGSPANSAVKHFTAFPFHGQGRSLRLLDMLVNLQDCPSFSF